MKKYFIHSVLVLFLLLIGQAAQATHMVGGEINYRCLGNNQYEIMVTVFRDCDTGVPWFDNPASIGVFDTNDSLIYDLRLNLRNNDTLELSLSDPCLVAPPNVCIHTTTYIDTVSLPFIAGGYQIVYQRCCRNQDIVNIVNPTGTGATYSSFVSEQALLACNSSARFKEWPPVYICQGVPIVYDHSAIDPDGDSIVYELCTPLTGATAGQSMPQPPNNPPYNNVTWQPPYGVNNMLGGPDSLVIDPQTGLLTGTPDIIGVFVVGVCAKEYRNGVLISTTRRDFQYVVGVCGRLVSAAFFAPDIQCDNSLIVNFQNNSTSLGTGYVWNFGDTITNQTSTAASPSYIYPDTGLYQITLIADPGSLCADTMVQDIYLQYESILTDFDAVSASCTDSLQLDITDLTIDTISTITQWNWDFGNGDTDTIPFASTVYDSTGTYIITLRVTAANGCTATHQDTLVMDIPSISVGDTIAICPGDTSIFLNPGGNPTHSYQWSPATGLSSDTAANPLATVSGTQTYNVTVSASNGIDSCRLERSVTVIQSPTIQLDVIRDTLTCADTVWVVANVTAASNLAWSTDPNFGSIYSTNDTIAVPLFNLVRLYVRASNDYGCSVQDTVDIIRYVPSLNANFTYSILACDSTYQVQFTDLTTDTITGPITAWSWTFGDGTTSNLQNPTHQYTSSGPFNPQLTVTSAAGCTGIFDDVINFSLPLLNGNDTVGVCQGQSGAYLNVGGDTSLQYQWSPTSTLDDSTSANPLASPTVPTTYTVTITAINNGDTCVNVQQVHLLFPPPITVSTPANIDYCGTTVQLTATSPTAVSYVWAGDPSFNIIVATGSPVTVTPQTFPFALYYVRASDAYGCTATDNILVQQNAPVNVSFGYNSLGCSDSIDIQFTDMTSDTASSPIASWSWVSASGQTSSQQNPIFTYGNRQMDTVTLTVTLANGCSGSFTQFIELNTASLAGDTVVVVCEPNTPVQLNMGGNPNLTYQWSPSFSLSSGTDPSPIAIPPSHPYIYTVTITGVTLGDTCRAIHDVTVVQAPPMTIEVPKDTIICGSLFNITANVVGASQIEWSFSPTFNPIVLTNITSFFVGLAPPPTDLFMYIRATDSYGCVQTDTAIVRRRNIPIPVDFTIDILECDDTLDVQLTNTTVYPSSLTPVGWTWDYSNGQTTTGYNANHQLTGNPPHYITLSTTSTNGCSGQKIDSIEYLLPYFNEADTLSLCGGDSVQLNTNADSNLIYRWSPALGLSDSMVGAPWASPSTPTTYTVTITAVNNLDTCEIVRSVNVGVDSLPFEAMGDTLICSNQITMFVNTDTSTSVEWALDRDFNLIIGQSNPLVMNLHDSRWIYVRGVGAYGCKAIDSVFVQHLGADVPVDFEMIPVNCGDSLIINFQDQSNIANILNWNWDLGNGQTSTLQNPTATYWTDSTYQVKLTLQLSAACFDSTIQSLTAQIPTLSIPTANLTTCGNDSIELVINTDTNLTFVWSPNIGLSDSTAANPTVLPPTDMTYSVRVYGYSNLNGIIDTCWLEDSIQVTVSTPPTAQITGDTAYCDSLIALQAISPTAASYAWALGSDFQNIITTNALLNTGQPQPQQMYYVQVVDSVGCTAVDSIEVNWALVAIDLPNPVTLCADVSTTVSTTLVAINNSTPATNLTFDWSPASAIQAGAGTDTVLLFPNTNGAIQLIASNALGCADTVTTTVNIAPPLSLGISNDTTVCQSTATVAAWSGQATNFTWATDTTFTNVLGTNAQLQTNVPYGSTTYYLVVEDNFGCEALDSVMIRSQPPQVQLDSANLGCGDSTARLTATNLIATDSLTYQWEPTTAILQGQGTDTAWVAPNATSTYNLLVENQYGCVDTAQTVVNVSVTNPSLSITAGQDTVSEGGEVQLQATQQTDYVYTWQVDSTLSSTTIFNPTARPNGNTTYYLTITDAFGCIALDSITIITSSPICAEPYIFVPNAFTPDGDGHNDVIIPKGTVITDIYFVIYNRWGEEVFQTNQLGVGWDGTYKGKALPPGVYGFYVKCSCLDGNQYFKKGNITLIR